MGTFTVNIQISDLSRTHSVEATALVDTGTTYTTLPGNMLSSLGIAQEGTRRFELADNRIVEYPVGYARLRVDENEIIALVVFAPEGTDPLLGATALEIFSLAADPVNRRLVPIPALMK